MKLNDLTLLVLELNSAIDKGRNEKISISETLTHIEAGDILAWLPSAVDADFDLSLQRSRGSDREIVEAFRRLANVVDFERKFGIKYGGLCALLALTNELIQQQVWKE